MTHGHQMRGSANAAGTAVAAKWWEGQIMGTQPIANADMLMTAHRHYLEVSEMTGRTIIQAPAFDGGSFWYTSATGRNSPRGLRSEERRVGKDAGARGANTKAENKRRNDVKGRA